MLCKKCGKNQHYEHNGHVSTLCSVCLLNNLFNFVYLPDTQRSLTLREAVAPKQPCPSCNGMGHTLADGAYSPCMTCYGSGQV